MNRLFAILLFAVAMLASCIKNDLPKPTVDLYIASLDVEGVDGDIVLDRSTYTATIPLAEDTNIEAVTFKSITYGAEVVTNINYDADASKIVASRDLNGVTINMSQPEYITLSYYQTYEWKIVATQTINRIWTVDGQIGATIWDIEGHRAIVRRRSDRPIDNVKTTDVRFGPTPAYDYPEKSDIPTKFTNEEVWEKLVVEGDTLRNVKVHCANISVSAFGHTSIWDLVVVPTLAEPEFKHIGAGANVIWIKANAIDGSDIIFKYRKSGSEEWLEVAKEWYASADAHLADNPYNRYEKEFVKAVLRNLEPNSEYEIQGWANTKLADGTTTEIPSKIFTVTTSSHYQIPNSNMEEWGKFTNSQKDLPSGAAGPCWYPFSSVTDMFWATGNPGGTSMGEDYNLTTPAYDKNENGETINTSAYMGSRNVLNMKFAAGNLFVGHYGETLGTNATVFFGRPVSQDIKPVAIRFKIKYLRGGINFINSKKATTDTEYHIGSKQIKVVGGEPDVAKIFFALTDWKEPHCVYSADETTFFDPRTAPGLIGLGYFDSNNTPEMIADQTEKWHTMTIPIEYVNPEAVPSCLVLTFTCSGYGDYFTGSSDSWMNVDDIELLYDLDEQNQPK